MEGKLQADLKLTAELSLKIEERSSLLTDRKEELDDLKLKNRLAKEKLVNLIHKEKDKRVFINVLLGQLGWIRV